MGICSSTDRAQPAEGMVIESNIMHCSARRRRTSPHSTTHGGSDSESDSSSLECSLASPLTSPGSLRSGDSSANSLRTKQRRIHFGSANIVELSSTTPHHVVSCESVSLKNGTPALGDYCYPVPSVPEDGPTHTEKEDDASPTLNDDVSIFLQENNYHKEETTLGDVVLPMVTLVDVDGAAGVAETENSHSFYNATTAARVCNSDGPASNTNRFSKKYEQAKNSPTVGALRR